jgi:hypothetical protein
MFEKKIKTTGGGSILDNIIGTLRSQMNSTTESSRSALAGYALSTESLSDSGAQELSTAFEGYKAAVQSLPSQVSGLKGSYSQSQIDAAAGAALIAGDIGKFVGHSLSMENMNVQTPGIKTIVVGGSLVGDAMERRIPAFEAYNESDNRNAALYSMAYNLQSAKQNEFGEALFPTVTVGNDSVGFDVSIRIFSVFEDVHRNLSGDLAKFKKTNLIRAFADATILKNDGTTITPVYRPESQNKFVANAIVPHSTVLVEGESIETAPLAVDVSIDLLGLSQTDVLLANGMMDITDSLDTAVSLKNIYATVGDDVFSFNTMNLPESNFTASVQGNYRAMNLAFTNKTLMVNKNSKNVDGSVPDSLAAVIANDLIVHLSTRVFGTLNLEGAGGPGGAANAELNVMGSKLTVESILDSQGRTLDLTAAPASTVVAAFAAGKVVGYDLDARRANTNRRQRGQLLDMTITQQRYGVPLRSPISVLRPVTTDGQTDSSDLGALITATHIRTSNQAVTRLLEAAAQLGQLVDSRDTQGEGPNIMGVGRYLVKPSFKVEAINFLTELDSLTSTDRMADISALMINKVRDMAWRMYRESNYQAAAEAQFGGVAPTPTVIIATDTILAPYMMSQGDFRTLGQGFDVKVVQSLDTRMTGKIFVTFGYFGGESENKPNPLHFGNMAWKPELTLVLPISRGGQISKELTVQPSFLHVVNLPILGQITVSGLQEAVAAKVAINTNETP